MAKKIINSQDQPDEALNTELKYKQLLADEVEDIRRICVQEQIPCFMAFGLREENQKEERYKMKTVIENKDKPSDKLKVTTIIPEVLPVSFTDRRFSDFINVLNDFHTVPPSEYAKTVPGDIPIIELPSQQSRDSMTRLAEEYEREQEKNE